MRYHSVAYNDQRQQWEEFLIFWWGAGKRGWVDHSPNAWKTVINDMHCILLADEQSAIVLIRTEEYISSISSYIPCLVLSWVSQCCFSLSSMAYLCRSPSYNAALSSYCVLLFRFLQSSTPASISLESTPFLTNCITTPNSSVFLFRLSSSKNSISS